MKRPIVGIAAGFVLGEVLALQMQEAVWRWLTGSTVLPVLFCTVFLWRRHKRKQTDRRMEGRILLSVFLILLAMISGLCRGNQVKKRLDREEEQVRILEGSRCRVRGAVEKRSWKEERLTLELREVQIQNGDKKGRFCRVLLYMDQACVPEWKKELAVGKEIEISGYPQAVKGILNPGEFDFRLFCRSKNIAVKVYGETWSSSQNEPYPYPALMEKVREHCNRTLEKCCIPRDRAVFAAMLLGDKAEMDASQTELYRNSGIAHLLAVSGQHLSVIGGGIYLLFRKLGLGFTGAGAAGAGLVISYGLFTGGSGSAMRAVIMILCLWLAAREGRTYDTLSAMGLAAVILLWKRPYLVFQSGFQLSFCALWAIAGPGMMLKERLGLKKEWQKGAAVSLCIQIVLAPVTLWHYFQYPLYGMVLNLLILPFVPVLMYSGLLVMGAGSISTALGKGAAGAGHYILEYYDWLCTLAGKLPGYSLVYGRPEGKQLAAYIFFMLLAFTVLCVRKKRRGTGSLAVLFVIFYSSLVLFVPMPVKGIQVLCMDVGQGDGILLRTGTHCVLIDGGSSSEKKLGEMTLEPCLKRMGITCLDAAAVSHGDSDHINGLMYLLEQKSIEVKLLILPVGGKGQEIYEKLEELQKKAGGRVAYMKTGDVLRVGEMEFTCIYSGEGSDKKNRNAHSLVICADSREFHMLFTGDMGKREEEQLLIMAGHEKGAWIRAHLNHTEILKTAHHGSADSSSQAFLEALLKVRLAVISYGEGNTYGHPSEEVIKRMERQKIQILTTGGKGAVRIRTP